MGEIKNSRNIIEDVSL